MNGFVTPTDYCWFAFPSLRSGVNEVNSWMPKPWGGRLGILQRGEPLLFKLKAPYKAIAGGFVEH